MFAITDTQVKIFKYIRVLRGIFLVYFGTIKQWAEGIIYSVAAKHHGNFFFLFK